MEDDRVRGVRRLSEAGGDADPGVAGASALVIADFGSWADLLFASSGEPVCRGERFRYRGGWWVVTGRRRDSGVAVAEPLRQ